MDSNFLMTSENCTDSTGFLICDFCNIFHNSNLIFLALDENFSILMFNKKFLEIINIDPDQKESLIGKNFLEFIPENNKERIKKMSKKLLQKENTYKEIVLELKSKYETCVIKWFNNIVNCRGINVLIMIGFILSGCSDDYEDIDDADDFRVHWENVINKHKQLINSIKKGEIFNA